MRRHLPRILLAPLALSSLLITSPAAAAGPTAATGPAVGVMSFTSVGINGGGPMNQPFTLLAAAPLAGVVHGATGLGVVTISASGLDLVANYAAGAGPLPSFTVSGYPTMRGYFVRVGLAMSFEVYTTVSSTRDSDPVPATTASGACALVPVQSAPAPWRNLAMACTITIGSEA